MSNTRNDSFFRRNGLTLVAVGLFLTFWGAQAASGFFNNNLELASHAQKAQTFLGYLGSSAFWEATLENWESEFLQMGLFVILTACLFQKGSGESRNPDAVKRAAHGALLVGGGGGGGSATLEKPPTQAAPRSPEEEAKEARHQRKQEKLDRLSPPVRFLYEHSLSIVLLTLFVACFAGHTASSWIDFNNQEIMHGEPAVSLWGFMGRPQLWFESFQNWQSEFLAITAMVVLSIFLREKDSTESKPVEATND